MQEELVDVTAVVAEIGDGVDRAARDGQDLGVDRDVVRLVGVRGREVRERAVGELHRCRDI